LRTRQNYQKSRIEPGLPFAVNMMQN
jgi:hypothetical protein